MYADSTDGVLLAALLSITLTVSGNATATANITRYTAKQICNTTLDVKHIGIGLLEFSLPGTSEDTNISKCACTISLTVPDGLSIGVQFLEFKQRQNCTSLVKLDRIYCLNNTTLHTEIIHDTKHDDMTVEISFAINLDHKIVNNKTLDVSVSIIFYMFSNTLHGVIECPNNYHKCDTQRCLPNSVFEYKDIYNLCQISQSDIPKQTTPVPISTEFKEEGYVQGLIIFGSVLGLFLVGLVSVYFCSVKHSNGQPNLLTNTTSSNRPVFTLNEENEAPPNYSDLTLDGIDVADGPPASDASSNAETILSPRALNGIRAQFRISTDASLDRVSSCLPPTYSDAIINEVKYHIHSQL